MLPVSYGHANPNGGILKFPMNANINETGSAGLSLQPQAIVCPKCQHKRTADDQGPDWRCPSCGVAYNKATTPSPPLAYKVSNATRARGDREIDRDEPETPRAIALSMTGRIGRLRYLAFSWLAFIPGCLLAIAAAIILPRHPGSGTLFLILGIVLCLWMPVRLVALRMHDLNLSAKWMLAALLLPGVAAVVGGPLMALMAAGVVWFASILLLVVPGTDGDNDYGPPPGANTPLVTVAAVLFLVATLVGVVGNIKQIRSGKLNPALLQAAAEQPGSGNAAETQKTARLTKSDFVGTWQGQNMSLRVDQYGNTDFSELDGKYSINANGPLRVLDGNRLAIGNWPTYKVLNVTVPPHVEGAAARMTLDGVELIRSN
jgi:uncharacterized membrane protein YhaH (DUF805 family)